MSTAPSLAPFDERLDRLVNLDLGGRGVEHLFVAAQKRLGRSPVGSAAEQLATVSQGATVLLTTGSVSRAWLSPTVGENDGPAGLAAVVRALWLSKKARMIVLAEPTLIAGIAGVLTAAGLTVLPREAGAVAAKDGSLASVVIEPFTVETSDAADKARQLLDELNPTLLFSTERVGRNADGIYCSMRGIDFGAQRARIDFVFDEASRRRIPTVAVGDGGNEIGMGAIADAVRASVKFGDARPGGGAGIGAVSAVNTLVTAAVSNWGCYAIVAALAARTKDKRLLHTPEMEQRLLLRGVELGLINSVDGIIDPHVDGIDLATHTAITEMIAAVVRPILR